MKIITGKEQEYADYKAKNNDPYGGEVVRYTEDWADRMEKELPSIDAFQVIDRYNEAVAEKIKEIADRTRSEADVSGITGFMYGCAVSALAYFWVHGEPLRRWHNLKTQIRDEGEKANASGGVLNPAILNIG